MALSEQDQRRIIDQESAWTDSAFGGMDLSQFPSLQPAPPEHARDDGRFAKHWTDTPFNASASALRQFVSDPDVEALTRVGEETGNPHYLREVRDRRGETVAAVFKRRCPGYVPTDSNFRLITATLQFNGLRADQQDLDTDEAVQALIEAGLWTPENLEAAYLALDREGALQIPAGQARNLSEGERLTVMRLAQSGYTEKAIDTYLLYSLEDDVPLSVELLNDPSYRGALDTAVMFVFEVATVDYVPDEARRAFLLRYAAGRPLTINLLTQGWETLKKREASYERSELLGQFQRPEDTPPPSLKEIDALDDAAVDDLYHRSLKSYADQFRRSGPGVLA